MLLKLTRGFIELINAVAEFAMIESIDIEGSWVKATLVEITELAKFGVFTCLFNCISKQEYKKKASNTVAKSLYAIKCSHFFNAPDLSSFVHLNQTNKPDFELINEDLIEQMKFWKESDLAKWGGYIEVYYFNPSVKPDYVTGVRRVYIQHLNGGAFYESQRSLNFTLDLFNYKDSIKKENQTGEDLYGFDDYGSMFKYTPNVFKNLISAKDRIPIDLTYDIVEHYTNAAVTSVGLAIKGNQPTFNKSTGYFTKKHGDTGGEMKSILLMTRVLVEYSDALFVGMSWNKLTRRGVFFKVIDECDKRYKGALKNSLLYKDLISHLNNKYECIYCAITHSGPINVQSKLIYF